MQSGRSLLASVLSDAVLVNVATILAFLVRFSGRIPSVNFKAYLEVALWITIIRIVTFYFAGLYEKEDEASAFDILYLVFLAVTLSSVAIVALSFYLRPLPFPRTVFVISWTFNILLVSGWHCYLFYASRRDMPPKRFLVVGGSAEGQAIIEEIKKQSFPKCKTVGLIEGNKKTEENLSLTNLRKTIRENRASEVIVASPNLPHRKVLDIVFDSEAEGANLWIVPGLYEVMMGKVELTHLGDIPLIKLRSEPLTERDRVLKRGLDILFSILILILFSPAMFLISLIIRLESRGPVLYKQERVGLREKIYHVYKFRSMFEDAEAKTGPILAKENDERMTKVGGFLRRLHLDELPQFVNILKGEMSVIGPRPERPAFVQEFKRKVPGYSRRFAVKPGIAGLAQLYGGYKTSPENKLKYDLAYINNWSLVLDLKIFFMSMEIILTRRM